MITIAKKLSLFFFFLMLGKHLELYDCYPKAHSYNNNSKCIKNKKDSHDTEDGGGGSRFETLLWHISM